jgi:regulatory protein
MLYHRRIMPKPKPPRIPTAQSLANIALQYLGRFAASESSLRRVLENRLRRVAMRLPAFAEDKTVQDKLREAIEKIIDQHKRSGVINDAVYAETKINSLRRQGRSRRIIAQKLAVKGVGGEVVAAAFVAHEDGADPRDAELKAARALAKKRAIGPFRKPARSKSIDEHLQRRKEQAVLARGGFSFDVIRAVLGGDIEDMPDDY